MPSTTSMASAFLLTGMVAANALTTIEVCPAASTVPACTVTAQHQSVSTCVSPTTTSCASGKACSTGYSYSTYAYVSTVIPCGWDGKSISSCTVTKTDQDVPCSATESVITTSVPVTTIGGTGNFTRPTTTYSTIYSTITKEWSAPYNKLGPLAIPGFDGCELCSDCSVKTDGSRAQFFDVSECSSEDGKSPVCHKYTENRVSAKSVPASTTPVSATNSVKTSVPSAGTYTFTFTNTAPAATITANGNSYTIPPQPWFNYATRTCQGPTNFDITVTVTRTITNYVPFSTSTGSKTSVEPTNAFHWGAWNGPASNTATTTGGKPSGPTGSSFNIPVNSGSGSKYSKNDQYVGFPNGGDDAAVVSGKGNAANFYFDSEGNLMCDGSYISTSTGAGYLVFEKTSDKPSGPKFTWGSDGSFSFPGAGFCATDSTFFITFSGSPGGCRPVTCGRGPSGSTSTSSSATPANTSGWGQWVSHTTLSTTTKTASTTTTSKEVEGTTTSTTTYDPSADLDFPEPTAKAAPRRRGGVLRRRME